MNGHCCQALAKIPPGLLGPWASGPKRHIGPHSQPRPCLCPPSPRAPTCFFPPATCVFRSSLAFIKCDSTANMLHNLISCQAHPGTGPCWAGGQIWSKVLPARDQVWLRGEIFPVRGSNSRTVFQLPVGLGVASASGGGGGRSSELGMIRSRSRESVNETEMRAVRGAGSGQEDERISRVVPLLLP